jgi:hypothetical protein
MDPFEQRLFFASGESLAPQLQWSGRGSAAAGDVSETCASTVELRYTWQQRATTAFLTVAHRCRPLSKDDPQEFIMRRTDNRVFFSLLLAAALAFTAPPANASAAAAAALAKGQTVYVPVYSNVFAAPKEVPIHLANILTIRNTDLHQPIEVTAADYYDTKGTLIKKFYQKTVTLAPLETTHIYLSERDQEGGLGANFIVRWQAAREVNAPIIECLMVGNQGRAFVSPGQVIKEDTR